MSRSRIQAYQNKMTLEERQEMADQGCIPHIPMMKKMQIRAAINNGRMTVAEASKKYRFPIESIEMALDGRI